MRGPGDILLVSSYSLGHAPLATAWASAFLKARGFAPALVDLAVEPLDPARVLRARLIVYSVPMHTAMRIALAAHHRARSLNPRARACFFGHYAHLHRHLLLGEAGADFAIGGEAEEEIAALAEALARGGPEPFDLPGVHQRGREAAPVLRRLSFVPPDRDALAPLSTYVQLAHGARRRLVGYVEASRGCKHVCRHCPLTPVYRGRFFAVPLEVVLADVDRLVAQGATHLTFGDPDFFNGPTHAIRVIRAVHARHPGVSFDVTAKVEHLLGHADLLPDLRRLGCLFVVSAFESLSDRVLAALDKGHTRADIERVVALAREAGLRIRPSFVPFTPWSTLHDVGEIFEFVEQENLVDDVDPVQYTIRLLVPRGSALLEGPEADRFGPCEPDPLTHAWRHSDPRMDRLQERLASAAEQAARAGEDPRITFRRLRALTDDALGRPPRAGTGSRLSEERPPRLTEPWFC
jgi:radical SAM superfamily enzyme YgiQ (UPF0313 family)